MTKPEFIAKLNALLGQLKGVNVNTLEQFDFSMTAEQATAVFSAMAKIIKDELSEKGESGIPGICSLTVREQPERTGFNPLTGEKMTIPAKKVVKAKFHSSLKDIAANAPIYIAPKREQSEAQKANSAKLRRTFEEKRAAA